MRVVAVIAAYNEAERIATVLESVLASPLVDEVVVVDDGSTDGTKNEVEKYPVTFLVHETNRGKGAAIESARSRADGDIVVYIDADLVGLAPHHVDALVEPLIRDDELMMTVGRFTGGRLSTDLAQMIAPVLSGQRAVKRELLEGMPDVSETRFGVEVIFTDYAKKIRAKTLEVVMDGVTQVMKEEKRGYAKGIKDRLGMYRDLLKEKIRFGRDKKSKE